MIGFFYYYDNIRMVQDSHSSRLYGIKPPKFYLDVINNNDNKNKSTLEINIKRLKCKNIGVKRDLDGVF